MKHRKTRENTLEKKESFATQLFAEPSFALSTSSSLQNRDRPSKIRRQIASAKISRGCSNLLAGNRGVTIHCFLGCSPTPVIRRSKFGIRPGFAQRTSRLGQQTTGGLGKPNYPSRSLSVHLFTLIHDRSRYFCGGGGGLVPSDPLNPQHFSFPMSPRRYVTRSLCRSVSSVVPSFSQLQRSTLNADGGATLLRSLVRSQFQLCIRPRFAERRL